MIRKIVLCLFVAGSISCTTITDNDPDVQFKSTVSNKKQAKKLKKTFNKRYDALSSGNMKKNKNIAVFYDKVPDSFSAQTEDKYFEGLEQRLETVNVTPKQGIGHQLIAKVDITGDNGQTQLNGNLLQYPTVDENGVETPPIGFNIMYDELWQYAVCWPQLPLYVGTLTVYAAIPTWTPCTAKYKYTKEVAMKHMKNAVQAAGGDFGVATVRMKPEKPSGGMFSMPDAKGALKSDTKVSFIQLSIYKADKRLAGKKMKSIPLVFEYQKDKLPGGLNKKLAH